jgi:3-methylcrotonyl-CoA carboxylase alpha subunit
MKKTIKLNNQNVTINILHQNEKFMHFSFEGKEYVFDLVTKKNDHMTISFQQSAHQIVYHQEGFVVDGVEVSVELPQRTRSKDKVKAIGGMSAPMPGKILKILKNVGDEVSIGDAILVMEAMKMEHTIKADKAGKIEKFFYKEGDQVSAKADLVKIG